MHVGPTWVSTTFPDGTGVHASPTWAAEDYGRAQALGYGDGDAAVVAMTRDHDVLHSVLAVARGRAHSGVLWCVAHGEPAPPDADDEERLVMLLHRVAQVGVEKLLEADFPTDVQEVRGTIRSSYPDERT